MDQVYPTLTVSQNQTPNRFYAVPIIGYMVKLIMLIPVCLFLFVIAICTLFLSLVNSLVVLFTGKYWSVAYKLITGSMVYQTKIGLFLFGMTDKYPGFSLEGDGNISVKIEQPTSPNRFFAIPIFGGLARWILLIPFYIFVGIIGNAASMGILLIGWIPVLFNGKYSEGLYEFGRDATRLSLSMSAYGFGLSDKYPSFQIAWTHKTLKVILIILAILFNILPNLLSMGGSGSRNYEDTNSYYPSEADPSDAEY